MSRLGGDGEGRKCEEEWGRYWEHEGGGQEVQPAACTLVLLFCDRNVTFWETEDVLHLLELTKVTMLSRSVSYF